MFAHLLASTEAVLGFSDMPPSAEVHLIAVQRGRAMAIPVMATLPGATSATLASFNLYVNHPAKATLPGPFHLALYASNGAGDVRRLFSDHNLQLLSIIPY